MWPSRDIPLLHLIAQRDQEANSVMKAQLSHQIHLMQKVYSLLLLSKDFTTILLTNTFFQKRRYLEAQMIAMVQRLVHDQNTQQRVLTLYPKHLHKHLDCHDHVVQVFHRACFNLGEVFRRCINIWCLIALYILELLCPQVCVCACKSLRVGIGQRANRHRPHGPLRWHCWKYPRNFIKQNVL